MKELSIEEKAKRFDEILARAKGANIPYYKDDIMSKVKEFVDYLLPELKESEDEKIKEKIIATIHLYYGEPLEEEAKEMIAWLEKQGEQNTAEWSEEDEKLINSVIELIDNGALDRDEKDYFIEKLKSLKGRFTWKPSDEMLEALYRVIPENVMEKSEDEMLLDKLYQGLKYGRVLSEK